MIGRLFLLSTKPSFLLLLLSHLHVVSSQQCGIQANNAPCPYSWAPCCSEHGWCGSTVEYCGVGCQSGPCTGGGGGGGGGGGNVVVYNYNYCGSSWNDANWKCGQSCAGGTDGECPGFERCFADNWNCEAVPFTGSPPPPPSPPPPVPPPVTGPTPFATATYPDSRLIAYVGNWQACPTYEQTNAYTHIAIAFAVTYTWNPTQNICNTACTLPSSVPVCNNGINQPLVDAWRQQDKKVLLSFGGAGMGGSWANDVNNCWDYCFGKEEYLSSALVNIVQNQRLDGVDIDYEYCYDKAGNRHTGCAQTTNFYSDAKARHFLSTLTSKLRQKLDILGPGYELTHAPMDADLTPDSPYYNILKNQFDQLDFIMPQFYNGITRPVRDGFESGGVGTVSTASVYNNLVNDMFQGEATKVVFGFCISDCAGTGSNANGNEAVTVLQDLKAYNNKEFACNGGAFFWVAATDYSGGWSDPVWAEISKTTGCSDGSPAPTYEPTAKPIGPSSSPTTSPTASPTTPYPTNQPTKRPTFPTNPNFSTCGDSCASAVNNVNNLYPMADCVGFYICWDGQTYATTCAAGTLYDVDLQTCAHAADVNCRCTNSVITGPAPIPQPVTSPSSSCPTANWDLIGSADCSGYHHCNSGIMGEFIPCPDGQLFQASFKGCDFYYNVDCGQSGLSNPTPTAPSPMQSPISAMGPSPIHLPRTPNGYVWYPDWESTNRCQNDGRQPSWMDNHVGYYSLTEYECCRQWYWWTGC